eukprot:151727-Amphidinium_carterae.1
MDAPQKAYLPVHIALHDVEQFYMTVEAVWRVKATGRWIYCRWFRLSDSFKHIFWVVESLSVHVTNHVHVAEFILFMHIENEFALSLNLETQEHEVPHSQHVQNNWNS